MKKEWGNGGEISACHMAGTSAAHSILRRLNILSISGGANRLTSGGPNSV
jgi:hypothetical protein